MSEAASITTRRHWWLVFTVAAVAGVVSFINADSGREPWFRFGFAAGTMAFPVVSAWLVSALWKHPAAPVIVAAIISALSVAGTGSAALEARAATEEYTRELEQRVADWERRHRAFAATDAADPTQLGSAEAFDAAVARMSELERGARELLDEVEGGAAYREFLQVRGLSPGKAKAAWGQVSFAPAFERLRERLQIGADALRVAKELAIALRDQLGHWRRDERGKLQLDDGVDVTHADFIEVRLRRLAELRDRLQALERR